MLAQGGRACSRRGCLWRATAKEAKKVTSSTILPSASFHALHAATDEATASSKSWHAKGNHLRTFALTSTSSGLGARSFAQSSAIATAVEEEERAGEADASTITTVTMWEVDTVACRLAVTSRWSGRSLWLSLLHRLCQGLGSACPVRDR